MSQSLLEILQQKQALGIDKKPMKPREYDLTGGVPIIEIPRGTVNPSDFIIYDNVTSPNGVILIQGQGKVYHGRVDDSELKFEVQKIESNHPFGAIGLDKSDYYTANRQFVESLSSR